MDFFFITTDHLETRIWFRDDEDFRVGMNYVAVTAAKLNVSVISFILMSNHVHFLLLCEEAEANRFIVLFKKLYGTYFRNRYNVSRFLRRNNVDIQVIKSGNEAIERVVAYIVMNSVAARICLSAGFYKWGSGSCYFNENKETGTPLGNYSRREQIRLLKSNEKLPQNWIVGAGGYILPESYVQVGLVEKIFRTPSRMNYFLTSSSKAKKALSQEGVSFRDQIMQEALQDLRVSIGKKHPEDLSREEHAEIIKQLRWRFNADVHQISRVSGFSYSDVTEMLNSL